MARQPDLLHAPRYSSFSTCQHCDNFISPTVCVWRTGRSAATEPLLAVRQAWSAGERGTDLGLPAAGDSKQKERGQKPAPDRVWVRVRINLHAVIRPPWCFSLYVTLCWTMVLEMEGKEKPRPGPDYLMQLMNDKKLMSSLPNFCGIFQHLERLLDEEIGRVRKDMYIDTLNGSERISELPDAIGPNVQLQEKLYVPTKEHPDFNFVGRILGPRGLTAKQLEAETGCKIMVRGRGSMRDRKKEEQNRGKPNWEHLNEDLHVLITVEDAQNRAEIKLKRAVEEVNKLLVPAAEGEDSLKKMQLMELAILNGTYRDAHIKPSSLTFSLAGSSQTPRFLSGPTPVMTPSTSLRTPVPTGPALMPLIRQIQTILPNGMPHSTTLMQGAGPESSLIYTAPYDYPYAVAPASILEYPLDSGGMLGKPAPPCSCDCSPTPHHHPHGQWSPTPTLLLRHTS